MPDIDHTDPRSFKARLDSNEPLAVLDVREPFERRIATIPLPPTAIEIAVPMGEIPARLDEIRKLSQSRPLIVYCHHGVRSMVAASWLATRGLPDLINLDGGIDAWSHLVDPSTPLY
jgi:rhodanese-related sulfurtransferase